ncbi:hypothetical protein B0H17DRAFT_1142744 [Mycena rosella]|uniref:Uncharacterized protein n=1 Tax=Mycena rosella TaxID=1033263 RepID=A0AAD7D0M4_MYCRO|nr:hypothetical protein B0H17DRAFT_1142744 [Mycena rosella]
MQLRWRGSKRCGGEDQMDSATVTIGGGGLEAGIANNTTTTHSTPTPVTPLDPPASPRPHLNTTASLQLQLELVVDSLHLSQLTYELVDSADRNPPSISSRFQLVVTRAKPPAPVPAVRLALRHSITRLRLISPLPMATDTHFVGLSRDSFGLAALLGPGRRAPPPGKKKSGLPADRLVLPGTPHRVCSSLGVPATNLEYRPAAPPSRFLFEISASREPSYVPNVIHDVSGARCRHLAIFIRYWVFPPSRYIPALTCASGAQSAALEVLFEISASRELTCASNTTSDPSSVCAARSDASLFLFHIWTPRHRGDFTTALSLACRPRAAPPFQYFIRFFGFPRTNTFKTTANLSGGGGAQRRLPDSLQDVTVAALSRTSRRPGQFYSRFRGPANHVTSAPPATSGSIFNLPAKHVQHTASTSRRRREALPPKSLIRYFGFPKTTLHDAQCSRYALLFSFDISCSTATWLAHRQHGALTILFDFRMSRRRGDPHHFQTIPAAFLAAPLLDTNFIQPRRVDFRHLGRPYLVLTHVPGISGRLNSERHLRPLEFTQISGISSECPASNFDTIQQFKPLGDLNSRKGRVAFGHLGELKCAFSGWLMHPKRPFSRISGISGS